VLASARHLAVDTSLKSTPLKLRHAISDTVIDTGSGTVGVAGETVLAAQSPEDTRQKRILDLIAKEDFTLSSTDLEALAMRPAINLPTSEGREEQQGVLKCHH